MGFDVMTNVNEKKSSPCLRKTTNQKQKARRTRYNFSCTQQDTRSLELTWYLGLQEPSASDVAAMGILLNTTDRNGEEVWRHSPLLHFCLL